MDIIRASKRLSELDIQIKVDNFAIDILWFRVMELKGNWRIARHTHSSFEFHFVSSGSSFVILDDGKFIVKEGEFYVTAPGLYHEQRNAGDHYVEFSMNCDFKKIKDEFSETDVLFEILSEAKCRPVKDYYEAMKYFELALQEAYEQKIGFYNNIKSLALMIITMATRAIHQNCAISYDVPQKLKEDEYRFTMIEKFIKDNITTNITTRSLENYMHLSAKQINRIVRKKTGKSTKEFINFLKLEKAKEMLKNTNLTVKEISEALGFSSEYYFNQFFKREEGFPPGLYRSNIRYS